MPIAPNAQPAPPWPAAVGIASAAAVVFALVAPRLVLASLAVLLVAITALALGARGGSAAVALAARDMLRRQAWLWRAILALAVYLLASVDWAPDRINGAGKVALLAAIAAAALVMAASAARLAPQAFDRLARALLIGLGLGAAYLLIEEATGHAIKGVVFNAVPALRPDARHLQLDGDLVQEVNAYLSNRNVALLALVLWPMLALVERAVPRRLAIVVMLALAAVTGLVALLSAHASSRLALAAGLGIYLVARLVPRHAVWLAIAGWLALTLLMPPFATALYARGLHLDERVPFSFRARIILWAYTVEQIPARFWRGVGVDGTKPLDRARNKAWETRPGHVYPQRTGEHSHNFYIQAWHELGALGVALLSAFGVALLVSADRLDRRQRPLALAAVMTAAGLGATSWGIWQPWLMGALGLSAALMAVAAAGSRSAGRRDDEAPATDPESAAAATS